MDYEYVYLIAFLGVGLALSMTQNSYHYESFLKWTNIRGEKIKLKNMNVHHILFTIWYIKRNNFSNVSDRLLDELETELYLRWDDEKDNSLPDGQDRASDLSWIQLKL
jgi:hypothetical protein